MTQSEILPGLMLVHGNQAESLRDLLVQWSKRYPLAPLESEVVLVQSNGIAQWLRLALAADPVEGGAGGCGIAAALDFSLPSRFLWQAYRAVLGPDAVPEASAFDKSRLVWRLMRLLPEVLGETGYEPLRQFLLDDADLRKRFQLAERLADLYDQYQVYRADWLAAWAEAKDVLIDARGQSCELPEEQRWQADLWRRLLADIDQTAAACAGRAAVHEAFLRTVRETQDSPRPTGLPRRLLVFGISSMPRQSLEAIAALAKWSQVLVCVLNPCEHYWADLVAGKDLLRAQRARQQRKKGRGIDLPEDQLHLHAHPLLAAWGKQGRDFIALLDEYDSEDARERYRHRFADKRIDLFVPHGDRTLLQQLQDDIRELRPLQETREKWVPVDPARDDSIRFHVAHSPQREVEILHDQLLAAFDADPDLRPRDVIVMVPDIAAYAPHIQAVFGLVPPQDKRHIPYSIADQGKRHVEPILNALEVLLRLPQSRVVASEVIDLLEVPALRRAFGIAVEELPLLHRWIRGANIRWGLHASHRASFDLPQQPDVGEAAPHTWLFGLRRMMLGYAVGLDSAAWHDIEPYGEIGGLEAASLGALMRLFERLEETWRELGQPAAPADWCDRLNRLIETFFDPGDSKDAFILAQLRNALARWAEACEQAKLNEALPLAIVAEQWLTALEEDGLSQRFFGGAVTFATLMPMRAIPFRQLCLLGMNDGDYPRARMPMDFDLMGRDYRPGDRSRRDDDRYLFLEALLSARSRLYLSWVGRSVTDNSARPPSVLIGQLRDHLDDGWRLAQPERGASGAQRALVEALTLEHPLQPFSPQYFPDQGPGDASPFFTYAREWRTGEGCPGSEGERGSLEPLERDEPLTLGELSNFLKDPVKAFFNKRLDVWFDETELASVDIEPFELDGLERWKLQDELIRAQTQAFDGGEQLDDSRNRCLSAFRRRGDLPNGGFGRRLEDELVEPMDALFENHAKALDRWPEPVEGDIDFRFAADCGSGQQCRRIEIADRLGGLRRNDAQEHGRVVLAASSLVKDRKYSGDKLIPHWITHLAFQVATGPVTTVVVSKAGVVELAPIAEETARAHLRELLEAWREGMRRPLPLAAKTAFAWMTAKEGKAESAARKAYMGDDFIEGELATSPYLQRAWPSFEALTANGEFPSWTERLLRPLQAAIPAASKTEKKGAAE